MRGIISLPGDAFRRSGARVKTSVLCVQKKISPAEIQPPVFVAFAEKLGVDDLTPRASNEEIATARNDAESELNRIASDFRRYLGGDETVETVAPERIQDRFDLKFVVPLQGRYINHWKRQNISVSSLAALATPIREEVIPKTFPDTKFTLLKVSYTGFCQPVKTVLGKSLKPPMMLRVHTGNILFSNIRATDGAIGIVPPEFDGALVSESFTILKAADEVDAVCALAHSPHL